MISILGMFLIIAPLLAGLIVFLVLFLNRTKKNENNNLIYEDEMDKDELKQIDDELH